MNQESSLRRSKTINEVGYSFH